MVERSRQQQDAGLVYEIAAEALDRWPDDTMRRSPGAVPGYTGRLGVAEPQGEDAHAPLLFLQQIPDRDAFAVGTAEQMGGRELMFGKIPLQAKRFRLHLNDALLGAGRYLQ